MGTSKALLRFRETTFLGGILDAAFAVGLAPRIVVVGYDADKILRNIDLSDVTVVASRNPAAGPIASIRAGIEALVNQAVDGALIWHVDQPHVRLETIRALLDAFRLDRPPIVVPTLGNLRGHPLLLAKSVFKELWGSDTDLEGVRAVVHRDPGRVRTVPVEDPSILEDIDTPEAYQRLLKTLDSMRE